MKKMRNVVDLLVGKLVGEESAGACVPTVGTCCAPRLIQNCYGHCISYDYC